LCLAELRQEKKLILGVGVLPLLVFFEWMRVYIPYMVDNMSMGEKGDAAYISYKQGRQQPFCCDVP
jgi:hypothetical protein